MRDVSALPTMTVEEYFQFEETSQVKHEYVAGEVYAKSGVTVRHDRIATNVLVRLSFVARPGPGDVFSGDMRVQVDAELTLNEIYERVELPSVSEPEPVYEVDPFAEDADE